MKMLGDELRVVDKALARLTANRLSILDQIAKLDAEDGASERQTASRVARLSASTPKQAAAELATAKQVSALPKLAEAHANGEISNGQLGAVASIAAASSEGEALEFAKTATSSQLQQRASASRGKLFEERRKAHSDRYLGFKPEEGGQSVRIHGRLAFAESQQLEAQLRKIADRLNLCDKDRPSPSARMADALLILTNSNASKAVHEHLESKQRNAERTNTKAQSGSSTQSNTHTGNAKGTRNYPAGMKDRENLRGSEGRTPEWDPSSSGNAEGEAAGPESCRTKCNSAGTTSAANSEPIENPTLHTIFTPTGQPTTPFVDYDEEPFPETSPQSDELSGFNEEDEDFTLGLEGADPPRGNACPPVVVQRADTRLIIHWNAQTGSLNIENGPPIDHPRLQAILCDAQIDIQHCDINGLPTGLITTAHHSDFRQDRYLAYRDGPCRIPECLGIGKTQAHHIFENRIDRTTSVQHMINICNRDHQEHHDGKFTITGDPEQTLTFTYQDGTTLTSHARPIPITLKTPKPTPFAKRQSRTNFLAEACQGPEAA